MSSLCLTAAAASRQSQRSRCQFNASARRCAHSQQRGRRVLLYATAEDIAARARPFPFTRIAGQEEMKQALILNVVDPNIGGVLIMGDRGTGKSVAVRVQPLSRWHRELTYMMLSVRAAAVLFRAGFARFLTSFRISAVILFLLACSPHCGAHLSENTLFGIPGCLVPGLLTCCSDREAVVHCQGQIDRARSLWSRSRCATA
jgi:hypothetical protein